MAKMDLDMALYQGLRLTPCDISSLFMIFLIFQDGRNTIVNQSTMNQAFWYSNL